jgi:hypothetical protein
LKYTELLQISDFIAVKDIGYYYPIRLNMRYVTIETEADKTMPHTRSTIVTSNGKSFKVARFVRS